MSKTRRRPRNTWRYELKNNRQVVYRGITNNPDRREVEHDNTDKKFTALRIIGPAVTRQAAELWEEKSLETYRQTHGGKNPEYNETDSG